MADLRFPTSGDGKGYWLQLIAYKANPVKEGLEQAMSMLKQNSAKKAVRESMKIKQEGTVSVAISNSVSDSSSHEWGEQNLTGGIGSGNQTNESGSLLPANLNQWMNTAASFTKTVFGKVVPPVYLVQYNSSSLRDFSFDLEFLPQSEEEAKTVQKIILTLKMWASPSGFDGNDTFDMPRYIEPKLLYNSGEGVVNKMIAFNLCVISNINVNYFDGNVISYNDGMPKKIRLTISLKEISVNYGNDYKEQLDSIG